MCGVMDPPWAYFFSSSTFYVSFPQWHNSVIVQILYLALINISRVIVVFVMVCFHSQLNFQHWQAGEPNNKNNVESCAQLSIHSQSDDGSWNDVHCERFSDWLCQIRAGTAAKMSYLVLSPRILWIVCRLCNLSLKLTEPECYFPAITLFTFMQYTFWLSTCPLPPYSPI